MALCSGTIGEEVAVRTLKCGVDDYVMKSDLTRLLPRCGRSCRTRKSVRRAGAPSRGYGGRRVWRSSLTLRRLGVQVAIDDFGTAYSSLAYLAQLPVESLKIDRSFIVSSQHDPDAATLVSTIISLAHALRLKVVAEGVETEDQARFLRLLRCDEMQGYLFSKPVPNGELVKLLGG